MLGPLWEYVVHSLEHNETRDQNLPNQRERFAGSIGRLESQRIFPGVCKPYRTREEPCFTHPPAFVV